MPRKARGPGPQPELTLAAVLDGANTSQDIADVLKITPAHARVVINRLLHEGALRWSGRSLPREGCQGWGLRIYEVV